MEQAVFGEKLKGKEYKDRYGAYVLIFDENNRIATVKTPRSYFLPGGGIERNETPEECAIRECIEELGYLINIKELLCKGELYHWAVGAGCYLHSIGNFYVVDSFTKIKEPIEEDHELLWLSVDECLAKLCLKHQAWAVEKVKCYMKLG